MRTAKAIYRAPVGDAETVKMGGVTFKDGVEVEINDVENPHLFRKLQTNPCFDVEIGEEEATPPRRKPGRPSNAEKAAGVSGVVTSDSGAWVPGNPQGGAPEHPGGTSNTPLPTVQPIT